jgi:hypothetical protein
LLAMTLSGNRLVGSTERMRGVVVMLALVALVAPSLVKAQYAWTVNLDPCANPPVAKARDFIFVVNIM